jgi:hypothetical protein
MCLDDLPPELLDGVLSNLNVDSLRAIRLTNRVLYDRTFDTFANKVANQRWLFRETSLAALKAAGSHPRLRERIEKFCLGSHKGQWVEFPTLFCCERNSKIATAMERIDRDLGDLEDWKDTKTNGADHGAVVIADVIQNLPALRGIEIGELCKPGALYQIGWLGSEWPKCAGECRGTKRVDWEGRDPGDYAYELDLEALDIVQLETAHADARHRCTRHWKLSMCFQEILHALTLIRPTPGTQALESLSVGSYDGKKRRIFGVGLKDMEDLQEESQYFIALQPVLADVRELKLAVELGNKYGPQSSPGRNPNLETWLSVFLKLVPRLETLHLYLDGWSQVQWRPRYTRRYLYHEAMALFLGGSQLQYLSHLKLCGLTIRADNFQHFVTFLERHADRLTHLTLTSIILDEYENQQQGRPSWPGRLDALRRIPLTPAYLELNSFKEKEILLDDQHREYMPVILFASSSQLQGCDKCLSETYLVTSINEAPQCGHTVYKNHDGKWPASEEVRVAWKYNGRTHSS